MTINGKRHDLWRAVDQDENVLDLLVQRRRTKQAAKQCLRQLLKGLQDVPRVIITAKLKSSGAAKRDILPGVEHRQSCSLNNRCENAHRPTRQQERRRQGCKLSGTWPALSGGVWPHGPTLPPTMAWAVRVGVPRREATPLRALGRNHGYEAGRLSAGSVEIAPGKCLLLPGDHIIPNNLTMPLHWCPMA